MNALWCSKIRWGKNCVFLSPYSSHWTFEHWAHIFASRSKSVFIFFPKFKLDEHLPLCWQPLRLWTTASFFSLVHALHSQNVLAPLYKLFPTIVNLFQNSHTIRFLTVPHPHYFYCFSTPPLSHPHLLKPKRFMLLAVHSLRYNPQKFMIQGCNVKVIGHHIWKHKEPIIWCHHSI